MLSLVTLPDPSDFFTEVSAWSTPVFDNLLPIAEWVIGIIIGVALIYLIVELVAWAFHHRGNTPRN